MPNFRKQRIFGRVVKSLFALFIILVNVVLLWRVFFSENCPKSISAMLPNDTLTAAYAEKGDALILQYQDQATVTRTEETYGYFAIPQCVFIPEADQVQIVFRYNNSTLRNLAKDYALSDTPSRDETLFDVTLVRTTDLTPEDREDNVKPETLSETRYHHTQVIRETTALYTYYRYVFEGVTIEDLTVGIFADVYYTGDIDYEAKPYGSLCIYDDLTPWRPYQLTKADRAKLASAN